MDTDKYICTLQECFLPYRQKDQSVIMQEDNAPCHKSKASQAFKSENGINTLDWVPYSPDLSPIEKLFAILKKKVAKEIAFK